MIPYRSAFMMMLTTLFVITAPGSPADAAAAAAPHRWDLEVEAGPVWQTTNDVQIPNDETGTRISLVDVVGKGPWAAGRIYLSWNLSEKRSLRAIYAPLSINETGELAGPVAFAGGDFTAGPVDATYTFNSYRLSYRQRFHEGAYWSWW